MINFGQVALNNKHICFEVPVRPASEFTTVPLDNGSLLQPVPPHVPSGILSFGKELEKALKSIPSTLNTGLPTNGQLSFGLPSLNDFTSKLKAIKVPTTVCISVGGDGTGIQAIFDQINNAISSIPNPNITLPIPDLSKIPFISLSNLIPSLNVGTIIPVDFTLPQLLHQIEERCAQLLLDNLDNIDPLLRLEQLIEDAQELCGLLQFSQLRAVINKIEQAKGDLVAKLINELATPAEKLAKLIQLYIDAVNSGALDIVTIIAQEINRLKFDSLVNEILKLNPRDALNTLDQEIKNQVQLGNFALVKQLLNAVNIVQNQFNQITNIGDAILQEPNQLLGSIQDKINQLVDIGDYAGIQQLLAAYDSAQYKVIQELQQLDPANLLNKGSSLLRDALQSLDIAKYDNILDQMAAKICTQGKNLIPSLPNVPEINPAEIPAFLR